MLLLAEAMYAATAMLIRLECRRNEPAGESLVRVWRWVSLSIVVLLLTFGFLIRKLPGTPMTN
jgi:hypothetical protein